MNNSRPPVAIVGGGIGGLTCALALADCGIQSVVFEQYAGDTDTGAGIQLSPNATRVLFRLGLENELVALSNTPSTMLWRDGNTDRPLAQFPLLEYVNTTYDAPFLQIFRPDLMRVLEARCHDSSLIDLRKGTTVEGYRRDAKEATLETSSGDFHTKLCIGADGTNSTIRKFTNSLVGRRAFGGHAYRTVIPLTQVDEIYSRNDTTLWLDSSFHVVTYAVGEEPFLNCVFVVESNLSDAREDFHRQKSSLHTLRSALREPSPLLKMLLERVPDETLYRWPLYQFPPMPTRSDRTHPVVLVGDAWHTTFPFAGQGAALAIEDAIALAMCLSDVSSGSQADRLARYENKRISRIRQVQAISARNRKVYHVKNAFLKSSRSWVAQYAYRSTTKKLFSYEGIDHN